MDPVTIPFSPDSWRASLSVKLELIIWARPVRPQECAVCEEKAFLYGEAYRVMLVSSHFTSIMRELMRCSVTQIN